MALSAEARRHDWMADALQDASLDLSAAPEMSVSEHTFRDRTRDLELGPEGNFSSRKYVPRAFYVGGGMLNRPKTREFLQLPARDQRRQVSGLEPRVATASFVDMGTVRGRVAQPPFDERDRFAFRAREKARELHPPMSFRAKNDLARVADHQAAHPTNDDGAWIEPTPASWRTATPDKWRGRDFRANTAQAANAFASLDGKRWPASVSAAEPAVVARNSVHTVLEKAMQLRARDHRDRDLGGEFRTVVRAGAREPAAPRRAPFEFALPAPHPPKRPYAKSLTAAPSSFGF
jgi:hypothetical protein